MQLWYCPNCKAVYFHPSVNEQPICPLKDCETEYIAAVDAGKPQRLEKVILMQGAG